jgi:hypothetical protein
MAEVFSDDLNLKISDLLSHPLYPATRQPCARLFMLMRLIQAHASECLRARPFTPARPLHERTRCCKRSFLTPSLVYFRNPKFSQIINTLNPPTPLNPSPGKNTYFLLKHRYLEAGLFLALP